MTKHLTLIPARAALTRSGRVTEAKHYVTEAEAAQAVDLLMADGGRSRRHRAALVRFLWLTGARLSEALSVRPRDLDTRTDVVTLVTLKTARQGEPIPIRMVPLPDSFVAELLYLAAARETQPAERLWPWSRSRAYVLVRDALVAAGVEHEPGDGVGGKSRGRKRGTGRAHPHALRHGHAIHALRNGASLDLVARNLGHASVVTTSEYLKATAEDVRAAYSVIFR